MIDLFAHKPKYAGPYVAVFAEFVLEVADVDEIAIRLLRFRIENARVESFVESQFG